MVIIAMTDIGTTIPMILGTECITGTVIITIIKQ